MRRVQPLPGKITAAATAVLPRLAVLRVNATFGDLPVQGSDGP